MYIEPCCIHKQLPKLLQEHHLCFFQSNGDWTLEALMKAVAYMTDGKDMMIVLPTIDIDFCRVLRQWFLRGWLVHLQLLTWVDQTHLVATELEEYLPQITYVCDHRLLNGLIWFKGEKKHVLIQGDLLLGADKQMHLYTGYYGSDTAIIDMAVKPLESVIRVRTHKP